MFLKGKTYIFIVIIFLERNRILRILNRNFTRKTIYMRLWAKKKRTLCKVWEYQRKTCKNLRYFIKNIFNFYEFFGFVIKFIKKIYLSKDFLSFSESNSQKNISRLKKKLNEKEIEIKYLNNEKSMLYNEKRAGPQQNNQKYGWLSDIFYKN